MVDNVDDFLVEAINFLDAEQIKFIKKAGSIDVSGYHHSIGREIRNIFCLWSEDSGPLKADLWNRMLTDERKVYDDHWRSCEGGKVYQGAEMHADDASHELMKRLFRKIGEMP